MQPNYWSNDIAAQQAQDAAYNQASGNAPTATNSPNIFERLLPTAGSIVGGVLGLPGDIVSGGAASVGGAALGGTAGRALENLLTHQNIKNDLGSSAVQGTLGQAGGLALGKVASGILGGLVSPAAEKTAGSFVQGQFAPGTMTGTLAKQLFGDYGITDARQIPQIASQLTGKAGGTGAVLNNGVEDSLKNLASNGYSVDVGDLITHPGGPGMANDLIQQTGLTPTDAKSVLFNMNKSVQNMLGGPGGMVGKQEANPLDVLQESRTLDALASQARNRAYNPRTGVTNVAQDKLANVYSQLSDELKTRLFTPAGQHLPLTPDIKANIVSALSPVKEINPQAYNTLVSEVNGANTLQDLRSLQSKWVQANQAFSRTAAKADLGGGMTTADLGRNALPIAGAVAGKGKGVVTGTLGALTKSQALDRNVAGALSKVSDITGSQGLQGTVKGLGVGTGQLLGNLPNEAAPPTAGPTTDLQLAAPVSNNGGVMNEPNIFTALANPQAVGNQNLAPLGMQALISMFDPYLLNSGITGPAQTAEQNIQKANVAASLLPSLGAEFGQAGGGQGLIGGILSRLSGIIPGSPAANYGAQAQGVSQALTGAGIPTSPSTLPQLTQSTQTAADTIQRLQSLLQALGASPAPSR